jgi:hypothetical protein
MRKTKLFASIPKPHGRKIRSVKIPQLFFLFLPKTEALTHKTLFLFFFCCLGVGITVKLNRRTGGIAYISSPLDLMSWTAFNELGVRKSVWKENIQYFLPLYINRQHGERAKPLFKKCIGQIFSKGRSNEFHPSMAVEILTKLMNTMVVNVMQGKLHGTHLLWKGNLSFFLFLIFLLFFFFLLLFSFYQSVGGIFGFPSIADYGC